jgi:glutamate carboxypeptidase
MMRTAVMAALILAATTPVVAAPKPVKADSRILAAAEALRDDQIKLLETVVNIDSGTGDVAGGRKVAALLAERLRAMGAAIEMVPAEITGLPDNLVATFTGSGKGRVLLIGHLDTVFEPGTVSRWPFRIEGDRAYGPGVSDEKGGVVQAVFALQILKDAGFRDFKTITYLIETSEERGSPGTRALISRLLKDADVELNLEPGDAPDVITVWRKGSNTFYIDVKGRAAHAGVAPQDGRNAADELMHQLQAVAPFPKTGDGMTVNLTLMSAGSRYNIIPEDASAAINVRVREKAQAEQVAQALEASARAPLIPDTKVRVRRETSFPPLSSNASTDALADRAEAIYAGLGLKLGRGGNGGASQSALAADAGVPALDGLGPVGGGFHSGKEYLDLKSLTPRLYLLTRLIMDYGKSPPPPMNSETGKPSR